MITEIKPSERVLLAGKTGSGKTTLARIFLASLDRLVVVDSKFTLDPLEWNAQVIDYLPGQWPDRFRYILRADDLSEVGDALLSESHYYLYVDELYAVFDSPLKINPGWRGLWTRGREFSIGVWAGVQRPASIPLVTMSEADHYFVFRLNMSEDRDRLEKIIGVPIPRLPPYAFLYAHPASDQYWQIGRIEGGAAHLTKQAERATL